jgi:hypothetical protein
MKRSGRDGGGYSCRAPQVLCHEVASQILLTMTLIRHKHPHLAESANFRPRFSLLFGTCGARRLG